MSQPLCSWSPLGTSLRLGLHAASQPGSLGSVGVQLLGAQVLLHSLSFSEPGSLRQKHRGEMPPR